MYEKLLNVYSLAHTNKNINSQITRNRFSDSVQAIEERMERTQVIFHDLDFDLPHNYNVRSGLTSERISKFEHFTADESLAGEQCLICMDELTIGTQMVRLDCHVDHILCKKCVDKWFKDHKTCPTCRHVFK